MTNQTGQLVLFPARARRTHPVQSHLAADRKNESHTLSADRMKVLVHVYNFPGKTAKQLDLLLEGKAHRRAKDLDDLKLIIRVKSGPEMRLHITELGKEKILSSYQN